MDGSGAPAPRRRPSQGGYARGDETRGRIIEAAFQSFATEGYAGASTRRIAAEAGVNPPALQYYFHSKEGLHRACAQAAIDRIMEVLGPGFERARAVLSSGSKGEVVDALCSLVEGIAELAMSSFDEEGWSRFMRYCQTDPVGPGFTVMETEFSTPMRTLATALVGKALDLPTGDPTAALRAVLIFSEAAALHTKRASVLASMDWPDFAGERAGLVKAILREHVTRICAPTVDGGRIDLGRTGPGQG